MNLNELNSNKLLKHCQSFMEKVNRCLNDLIYMKDLRRQKFIFDTRPNEIYSLIVAQM